MTPLRLAYVTLFCLLPALAFSANVRYESVAMRVLEAKTNRQISTGKSFIKIVQDPNRNTYIWHIYQLTGEHLTYSTTLVTASSPGRWLFHFIDSDQAHEVVPVENFELAGGAPLRLQVDFASVNSIRQVVVETWTPTGGDYRSDVYDYRNRLALVMLGTRSLLTPAQFDQEIARRKIVPKTARTLSTGFEDTGKTPGAP